MNWRAFGIHLAPSSRELIFDHSSHQLELCENVLSHSHDIPHNVTFNTHQYTWFTFKFNSLIFITTSDIKRHVQKFFFKLWFHLLWRGVIEDLLC